MESIIWYINRLKSMSLGELWWRITSLGKNIFDGWCVACGFVPKPKFSTLFDENTAFNPAFRICDIPLGCWHGVDISDVERRWLEKLVKKASDIIEHRFSFFDIDNHFMGEPIDWHKDQSCGKRAPLALSYRIDYRDFDKVGDCKLVWEPNRHHQLVVLGRAYRVTGDIRYAQAVVTQMDSWLIQNPFAKGMNWRSPLELGIRLINWVWAIDLILESGLFVGQFQKRVIDSVYLHCRDIASKFSQGSSANNHLVGEAAGIFIATNYFSVFVESKTWCEQSYNILENEIIAQTYHDGCTQEHALGYQFFVVQFYLLSGLIARRNGSDMSSSYWSTLEQILLFIARLAEGGGTLPMFGDRDDGYVLDLGDAVHDVNALMSIASSIFDQEVFASFFKIPAETAFWLFGSETLRGFHASDDTEKNGEVYSIGFKHSGYYLLQYGNLTKKNKVSILFDCAELGYKSIAAHGHADALSLTMRINDVDLLVDTGTYDYFTYPKWRNYFRSTRAHNTVEIDGLDQSEMQGLFMWGMQAQSSCLEWQPDKTGGQITGQHDGYSRLSDPVLHQRHLELLGEARCLLIVDKLSAKASHEVVIHFHLSEFCTLENIEKNCCYINVSGTRIRIEIDSRLVVVALYGNESPRTGWLSRGYHQKIPITSLSARGRFTEDTDFCCRIKW